MKLRKNKERNHLKREIERVMQEREQVASTQLNKRKEFELKQLIECINNLKKTH